MSTKTTIKRVALVAAVALTLGGFSAVSASAGSNADVVGVSVTAGTAPTTTATLATPGTAAVPVAATVVVGAIFNVNAKTAAQNETITAFTTSDFSTTSAGGSVTVGSNTGITSGNTTPLVATTSGTYYVKVDGGTSTKGYITITAVDAAATTYDGTIAGLGATTVSGVAGTTNQVVVTVTKNASGGKAGYVAVTGAGATIASIGGTASASGATTGVVAAASSQSTVDVVVNTPTAGAVSFTYAPETAAGSRTAAAVSQTVAITVAATGSSGVLSVANSTVYDTITIANAATADASLVSPVASGAFATITPVVAYNWALADVLKAAYSVTSTTKLSVVVTGPGVVSTTPNSSASAAKALTVSSGSSGQFYLYGDGTSGVATVTVSVGTTVVATKSVTLYSSTVASISAKTLINYVGQGAGSTSAVIAVTAKDALGNVIPGAVISAAPDATNLVATIASTATTASSTTSTTTTGVALFAVTGTALKSGVALFNFTDSTGAIKASASTNVSDVVAASLTITPSATSAAPGDKVTYSLMAKDANGLPIADGTYTFFAAKPSVSTALGSNPLDSTTVTTVDGVATGSAYAPAAGKIVISWTLAGTAGTASGPLAKTLTATVIETSVDVAGSADSALAVDAANAATDAANAAAEEASNATEAASEALAAVNSLATTVASLIAGIKKQLVALTALVKKLQK